MRRSGIPPSDAKRLNTPTSRIRGLIGIGESLTASPSHTTGHTGHVSGGSLNNGHSHAALAGANSGSPIWRNSLTGNASDKAGV